MIIFEDDTSGYYAILTLAGSADTYRARKFDPALEGLVNKVTLEMKGFDALPSHAIKVELRENNAGAPSDDIWEESTTTITTLSAAYAFYAFEFAGTKTLSPGTSYWVIVYTTDAATQGAFVRTSKPGGSPGEWDDDGVAPWSGTVHDLDLKVEGVAAGGDARSWGMIIA